MNCPNCGNPLTTGVKFCPKCGATVAAQPAQPPQPQPQPQQQPQGYQQPNAYQQPGQQFQQPQQMQQFQQPSYQQPGQPYYGQPDQYPAGTNVKSIDKNIFAWVFCFLLGSFGVDRFVRGQIGIGVLKVIVVWATLGIGSIWSIVDWVIALVKAYGQSYSNDKEFVFIDGKYSK